ncbi:MAG: anti-sigma factor family protein [Acidobacteriota bacterium]
MITCRKLIDFLHDYLSGELPESQRTIFEGHLKICPSCEAYLQNYQVTIRLGREACNSPDEPPPKDVPEELIQAILAVRKRS